MHAIILLYCALFILVNANAYDYGIDIEALTRRQDQERILVGRLPLRSNGSMPHRLEIRQMRDDPHKWDLFILALSMFQYVSQDDPLSWYQVAGIHGVPFRSWNGVEAIPGANESGYCTHSSVLFPIWHRPYLALVEQEIFRMSNFIAGMFRNETERHLYQQAASDIRFPYWDWSLAASAGETYFPEVFWHPTIRQYGPRGFQTIHNPLYSYSFHPVEEEAMIWSPLRSWQETKRSPATNISLTDPPSNNNDVDKALLQRLPEIQQRLFVLFSNYRDFNSFGNKAWASSQNLSSWDSIESIHDIIHIYGGLRGHMTYVPLSSFDPLFFMHHVSMDRYTAIWQILNPSAWISPMPAGETSYTTLKGDVQTSKTALTPFYISEDGTFWNSDMARDTTIFGYTYADTDPALMAGEDLAESLIRKINRWWGGSGVMGLLSYRTNTARPYPPGGWGLMGRPKNYGKSQNIGGPSRASLVDNIVMKGHYTEWIANVGVNAETLGGSFTVRFFLGRPPTSCYHVRSPQNEVGSVSVFAMNMQTGSQSRVSGTLPLTSTLIQLVDSGTLANLTAGTIVPFLKKELSFAVCDVDNTKIEHELVEGLHIGIVSAEVEVPETSGELPRWRATVLRFILWS